MVKFFSYYHEIESGKNQYNLESSLITEFPFQHMKIKEAINLKIFLGNEFENNVTNKFMYLYVCFYFRVRYIKYYCETLTSYK